MLSKIPKCLFHVATTAYLVWRLAIYMQLPPEDKRKPHHDAEFFDLNTPCAQYKGVKYCVEESNRQSNDER